MKRGVEIENSDMENPDSVEIDQQMSRGTLFVIGLEEYTLPVDGFKAPPTLGWRDVNQVCPISEENLGETLWIPEKLIDVIIPDDLIVIFLLPNELSVNNFVTLVTHEAIQGLDDSLEINALGDGVDSVLALRTAVVIICAFENEAQTLWHEANIASFPPAQEVKGNLSKTIVLAHVIHSIPPTIKSTVKGFGTGTLDTLETLETRILGLANGIVEIELSSKVPFAIISMLASNIIGVDGDKSLIRTHARCAGIEKVHQEIKHIAH